MDSYDIGDAVRLTGTFRNAAGTLTDPTTVTLKHEDPSGNETSLTYAGGTVTKSSTGIYYADVTVDESGTWKYKWIGTGTVAQADEGAFWGKRSDF